MVPVVMWVTQSARWSSPAAHLLLCGPLPNRPRTDNLSSARGLGTPGLTHGEKGLVGVWGGGLETSDHVFQGACQEQTWGLRPEPRSREQGRHKVKSMDCGGQVWEDPLNQWSGMGWEKRSGLWHRGLWHGGAMPLKMVRSILRKQSLRQQPWKCKLC